MPDIYRPRPERRNPGFTTPAIPGPEIREPKKPDLAQTTLPEMPALPPRPQPVADQLYDQMRKRRELRTRVRARMAARSPLG